MSGVESLTPSASLCIARDGDRFRLLNSTFQCSSLPLLLEIADDMRCLPTHSLRHPPQKLDCRILLRAIVQIHAAWTRKSRSVGANTKLRGAITHKQQEYETPETLPLTHDHCSPLGLPPFAGFLGPWTRNSRQRAQCLFKFTQDVPPSPSSSVISLYLTWRGEGRIWPRKSSPGNNAASQRPVRDCTHEAPATGWHSAPEQTLRDFRRTAVQSAMVWTSPTA